MPRRGAEIGIGAVLASFVVSIGVWTHFIGGGAPVTGSVTYFELGGFRLEIGQNVDGLAAVMFVVVTLVSLLVQVYSTAYMHGDRRYTWYFAALSLFTASMLNLVIADNLFQLLVGWELVGICSYLLIGHWWEEKENSNAAIKAFITTKTGDIPFLFGIFVLTIAAGTTNIPAITHQAAIGRIGTGTLTVAALLLFGGAIGKSAQFPLHVWLPDAMAGPPPVSALIHAATMVTAGVYMVVRSNALFRLSPAAMMVVATVGALTALFAATIGIRQWDIKKILAYSTVSQLGFMFIGVGVGAFTAGLFHVVTHAFFKACLFLGSGSVIHAMSGEQDIRSMGGLRKKIPITYWTFLIATVAIAGFPPLAGFFSKDEILASAWATPYFPAVGKAIWAIATIAAFFTAFYMYRLYYLTFYGDFRGTHEQEHHLHESPPSMTIPLWILGALSLVGGLLGIPQVFGLPPMNLIETWLHPVVPHLPSVHGLIEIPAAIEITIAAISTLLAIAGWWLAKSRYQVPQLAGDESM